MKKSSSIIYQVQTVPKYVPIYFIVSYNYSDTIPFALASLIASLKFVSASMAECQYHLPPPLIVGCQFTFWSITPQPFVEDVAEEVPKGFPGMW